MYVCMTSLSVHVHSSAQVKGAKFSEDALAKLTHRIQFGGDEVSIHTYTLTPFPDSVSVLTNPSYPSVYSASAQTYTHRS